jgi:hypothetical protein
MKTTSSNPDDTVQKPKRPVPCAANEATEALNRVCAGVGDTNHESEKFVSTAAGRVLERNEW